MSSVRFEVGYVHMLYMMKIMAPFFGRILVVLLESCLNKLCLLELSRIYYTFVVYYSNKVV